MFISTFCCKSLIWIPVSFPSLLVPCTFSFISLFIAFTFSSNSNHTQPFLWASWLPVFWTVHLIGWLSLHRLVVFFLEFFICSFTWGIFFLSCHTFYIIMGWSLRCLPGRGKQRHWVVALDDGEGSEREQCRLLGSQLSVTSCSTHKQIGPFWCWFLGQWVCVCFRTLWVSPEHSPVWLGVSPTTTTLTGFYS